MNIKTGKIKVSVVCLLAIAAMISVFLIFGIKSRAASEVSYDNSGLSVDISCGDSWNDNGSYGAVMQMTVKNTSNSSISDWNIVLTFPSEVTLNGGWSGEFAVSGNKLTITPAAYNTTIAAGSEVNMGFLIKTTSSVDASDIEVLVNGQSTATSVPTPTAVATTPSCVTTAAVTTAATVTATPSVTPVVTPSPVSGGFYVKGTKLYDANGNEFILRGINHAHTWYKDNLDEALDGIEATGANSIRVVLSDGQQWTKDDVNSVSEIIEKCKERKMIAVLEVHDGTGSNSADVLNNIVNYWIEIKDALIGNEEYVILNIANEWFGEWSSASWGSAYQTAIKNLRNAGFTHTIMVDSAGWGQYPQSIVDCGEEVLAADTLGNTMFSIHMYEYAGGNATTIKNNIDNVLAKNLCVCIGEFGYKHTSGDVDEAYIMEYCTKLGVGYMGWSWKGNGGGVEYLDLSNDWAGTSLSADWGEVLVNSTYGLKNTSKTCSVF